ncbi:MAG: molecular chaperone HtpG [Halobacteriovoraceae bacterium]|nr:molecular chaperone HtpG [Halobacteriovoraceae bacterium]
MTQRKGSISVQTTDIFPIIKKWLYSEHDIFLRELVANATDAITKRSQIARTSNQEIPSGKIQVEIDSKKGTVSITDNGLGMTEAEVEKYIAQLAFSGAKEFVEKLKEQGIEQENDIIGKFGLGFYSSFMVADSVVVESLSMNENAVATKWQCDGETEYIFSDSEKNEIGTKITLTINEENKEFLNKYKINEILKKYCTFLPYEIFVHEIKEKKEDDEKSDHETPINDTTPLWKKDPKEITEDEYKEFYRKMFPFESDPLFWIHLNVDHPFTLQGILYFPKLNLSRPVQESNIKLYCRQVFVSENVKNVIPDFLSLLKGAIDSTDIPLNVSRSSLQGDPNIKKISNYVIKKVAEALKTLFKKDREKYETIWNDISLFIKYGAISDTKFDDLMRERILFSNSDQKLVTLSEYKESVPEKFKEKLENKIIYFEKGKSDAALRKTLIAQGVQAIETDDHIDPHFMQHVEAKKLDSIGEITFSSVDAEFQNILESEKTDESDIKIKDLFKKFLSPSKETENDKEDKTTELVSEGLEVEIQKLKGSTAPAYIKVDEQMKRFSKMAQSMGQNKDSFPIKKTLVINPNSPLIQNALTISQKGGNDELVEKICHHVEDLALISSEGLKDEYKDLFVQRSQELIQKLTGLAL